MKTSTALTMNTTKGINCRNQKLMTPVNLYMKVETVVPTEIRVIKTEGTKRIKKLETRSKACSIKLMS